MRLLAITCVQPHDALAAIAGRSRCWDDVMTWCLEYGHTTEAVDYENLYSLYNGTRKKMKQIISQ